MPTPRIIRIKAATDQKCPRPGAAGRGEPGKPEAGRFGGGSTGARDGAPHGPVAGGRSSGCSSLDNAIPVVVETFRDIEGSQPVVRATLWRVHYRPDRGGYR